MPRGPRRNFRAVAGQVVALERGDVDRHLAHRLAGVDEVGHARLLAHRPDRGDVLDQARVGRDPRHVHQPAAVAAQDLAHRLRVDAAVRPVLGVDDRHAQPLGERQELDLIRGVVGMRRHDDVAALQVEGRHRLHERGGGARGEGDVASLGADQRGHGGVRGNHRFGARVSRFVATQLGFEREVLPAPPAAPDAASGPRRRCSSECAPHTPGCRRATAPPVPP